MSKVVPPLPRLFALAAAVLPLVACGSSVRRFPLKAPLWQDDDMRPFVPAPPPYESPFAWDAANQTVFRPISRFFAVDPAGEAINVNAFDEVPDSSWFVNRIGRFPLTPADVAQGPCERTLDVNGPDGSWIIDQGKPNGDNPGFRVNVPGVGKFMLKADEAGVPEKATGADPIAVRFYHAFGFWAPCDVVVHFRPSILKLTPGLMVQKNTGAKKPFDEAALARLLGNAAHRGSLVRMSASSWLPGKPLGPFTYESTRDGDPNDVIAHEERRELRGARLIAAWLNHTDSREQNTMTTWMAPGKEIATPGYVRHWYIDLGDCFGSEWSWDGISRRLGHAYYLDFGYIGADLATFGLIERPWERARKTPGAEIFSYFSARDFDPEAWRGGYPNPAFGKMTEHDAAWAARIIARFTDAHVRAAVSAGDFTRAEHTDFLVNALLVRRDAIVRRYLSRLSPLSDVRVEGTRRICGVDLAARATALASSRFEYSAALFEGEKLARGPAPVVTADAQGGVCLDLPKRDHGAAPDDAPSRYRVVDVGNGQAAYPLRIHFYDLGPRGLRIAGVERPETTSPP